MLRKLIKYELHATARTMGPMLGLVLLTAVGGNIAFYDLEHTAGLLNVLSMLLMAAFVIAMLAVGLVAFVVMIRRFYGNLLRDEGYLMMTLPVSVHQQILSKTIVSVIWFALTGVTMALALCILFLRLEMAKEMLSFVRAFFAELPLAWGNISLQGRALALSLMVYLPVLALLTCASMCLNCYAAMAIGHSFTHHKGLLSFAAYFALGALWQVLGGGLLWVMNATGLDTAITALLPQLSESASVHVTMLLLIVGAALSCALEHAITAYFLKNRLNLD